MPELPAVLILACRILTNAAYLPALAPRPAAILRVALPANLCVMVRVCLWARPVRPKPGPQTRPVVPIKTSSGVLVRAAPAPAAGAKPRLVPLITQLCSALSKLAASNTRSQWETK